MKRKIHLRLSLIFILLGLTGCIFDTETPPPAPKHNPKVDTAREYCHQVFTYLHKGYTDFAQDKLRMALQYAPKDPVVLDTAGYFYEKTGRIKLAKLIQGRAT